MEPLSLTQGCLHINEIIIVGRFHLCRRLASSGFKIVRRRDGASSGRPGSGSRPGTGSRFSPKSGTGTIVGPPAALGTVVLFQRGERNIVGTHTCRR